MYKQKNIESIRSQFEVERTLNFVLQMAIFGKKGKAQVKFRFSEKATKIFLLVLTLLLAFSEYMNPTKYQVGV